MELIIFFFHIILCLKLQSTVLYHRFHVSRIQNNSGLINSTTYINTKVRHACDSFIPHGSFLGITTEII